MSTNLAQQAQGNYPPPGDTTSEGGYGDTNTNTTAQRNTGTGTQAFSPVPVSERGLVDQTTAGQPLGDEMDDARLGRDEEADREYKADQQRRGEPEGADGYGDGCANETREDAERMLAESMRAKTYQDE